MDRLDRLYRLAELWGDCVAHGQNPNWLSHPIREIAAELTDDERARADADLLSIVAYRLEHRSHLDERDDPDYFGNPCHICEEAGATFDDREQVRIRAASVAVNV